MTVVKYVFVCRVTAGFDAVLHHHAGFRWTLELLDLHIHTHTKGNIMNDSLTAVSLISKYLNQLFNVLHGFL